MKYIRTENGVYEEQKTVGGLKYFELKIIGGAHYNLCRTDKLWNKLVIAEADTIEELCDEFVVVCDNEAMVMNKHLTLKEIIKTVNYYEEQDNIKIYGAIWTDKGLIYVAKMNEKGELELI